MHGAIKFIGGTAATSLLAFAAHDWLGLGPAFIDRLESEATSALGNAGGVGASLAFVRDPSLRRDVILTGDADAATRTRLIAAIRAVPGVRDARWADTRAAATRSE